MEILVVLVIALVVFGPKRLPELGNSLGKGIREFKGSISGDAGDEKEKDTEKDSGSEPAVLESGSSIAHDRITEPAETVGSRS